MGKTEGERIKELEARLAQLTKDRNRALEESGLAVEMLNASSDARCDLQDALADRDRRLEKVLDAWDSLKGMSEQFHGDPLAFSIYPDWIEEARNIGGSDCTYPPDPVPIIDAALSGYMPKWNEDEYPTFSDGGTPIFPPDALSWDAPKCESPHCVNGIIVDGFAPYGQPCPKCGGRKAGDAPGRTDLHTLTEIGGRKVLALVDLPWCKTCESLAWETDGHGKRICYFCHNPVNSFDSIVCESPGAGEGEGEQ